jgi:hypothetical protein
MVRARRRANRLSGLVPPFALSLSFIHLTLNFRK